MIAGEPDILWLGPCRRFAQSSGTSDGKSKYIPVTDDSLRLNHYRGGAESVATTSTITPAADCSTAKPSYSEAALPTNSTALRPE